MSVCGFVLALSNQYLRYTLYLCIAVPEVPVLSAGATPSPSFFERIHDREDDDSDISDGEGFFGFEDHSEKYIRLRLMSTRMKRVRELFTNTDKVHFYCIYTSS